MSAPASRPLDGQVAIVTGAGQGIGRAEALALADCGAQVVVNDVDAERARYVVAEIEAGGGQAVTSIESVTTAEGGQAIVQKAVDAFGGVHVVVNNAGFLRPGRFEDLSVEDIDQVIDVHLRAAFYVTQPAWRHMRAHGYGRIIMTSSSAGMFSQGANSNYCAAKAGVFGLARALAFEGADLGINVNVVLPFAATTISTRNPIPGNAETRERLGATYRGAILDRRGPELVAPLVAYLASPVCTTNGEVFSACAGRFARVFVGLGHGWLAAGSDVRAEQIGQHWDEVRDTQHYTEPRSLFEEVATVMHDLETVMPAE